jgi:hypothetical protein
LVPHVEWTLIIQQEINKNDEKCKKAYDSRPGKTKRYRKILTWREDGTEI